jgi:hypothetical protein
MLLVSGIAVAACANASNTAKVTNHPPISTTTIPSTTTSVPPPATSVVPPDDESVGPHDFTITGVSASSTNWLTVELHPTTVPIQLEATSTSPLEVCPANLDGTISGSGSWPPGFGFNSCIPLNGTGAATLPPSTGGFHLAFALRPLAPAVNASVTLRVDYSATDTFVAILPPSVEGNINVTVSYVPKTSTTGALVSPAGMADTVLTPGIAVAIAQGGPTLGNPAACDFATEVDSCLGGVVPNLPVSVNVSGPGTSKVEIALAWE